MYSRVISALAALLGVAGLVSQAAAQYYPSPPSHPSSSYRGVPLLDDDDLDDGDRSEDLPVIDRAPGPNARGRSPYPPPGRAAYPTDPAQPADAWYRASRPGETTLPRIRPPGEFGASRGPAIAAIRPDYQPEEVTARELPPHLRRQIVEYRTREPAGTVIIDTANTYLYLVLGHGKAIRYGIGVGREGFTWSGRQRISRMAEWPDWHPPRDMIERQPYLPRFMAGGLSNPLGARALYLGKTIYRIHGTNQPSTIGKFVSSGCIRMLNEDVENLYQRVNVGSQVVVLPGNPHLSGGAPPRR